MNIIVEKLTKKINEQFQPVSIFLYGSRARTDYLEQSDYEIGVLYRQDKKISRIELKKINSSKNINLYPFEYEDFIKYKIDTPFPENIYLRELILSGKTISGKQVIETLKPPPLKLIDLLQRIRFDTGFALAAVLSHRRKDSITARIEFSKSCFFGVRCLIILEKKEFPLTYEDIYKISTDIELGEYAEIVKHAVDVRKGIEVSELYLYKNISLLNLIKEKILSAFAEGNNFTVLE